MTYVNKKKQKDIMTNLYFVFRFSNWMLNFGLVFETALAAALCYTPYLDKGLNMYPLKYVVKLVLLLIFL